MVLLFLTPSFLPPKAVPVLDLSAKAEEKVTKEVKEKKENHKCSMERKYISRP